MLQLLIGPSGSGKSHRLTELLAAQIAAGDTKLFLIVPEQYSFESERTLLRRLSPADAARVQVLSFTRLADTVLRQVGGLAQERLDDATRTLLMSRAVEQTAAIAQDEGTTLLGVQPWQITDAAYIEQLLGLLDEIKQCAVPLEQLENVSEQLCDDTTAAGCALQRKTADLYRVFTAYEGLASACGADAADILTRLADKLPDCSLPDGATVLVDGFKGFTTQEMRVLERMMPRVADMVIALSTDTAGKANRTPDDDAAREFPLFSPVTDTIAALRDAAARHGLTAHITLMRDDLRHTDAALAALAAGLYHPTPTVWEEETDAITVAPCADIYEECAYVARRIRRLMREEEYRCRDITVVYRNPADYRGILDDALTEAGIPFFSDERQDILSEPLIVYIRAALRIAVGGWRTEELLRLLKTDLAPLTVMEIAELENYLYMWRIDGAALEQPFTENPAGMGAREDEHTARRLRRLEAYRQRIVTPLQALRQAIGGSVSGRGFARAIYTYLTTDGTLTERIREHVAALEAIAQPQLAERAGRIWDEVIALLDRFALALGDTRIPAARLEDLFTMLASTVDMGHIPQGLDAVTVGSADRIRYTNPRAVFILGANEEVFPAYPQNDGILTDDDRAAWEDCGVHLSGDTFGACIEERYYAYMATAASRERLFVSYLTDGDKVPSSLVAAIREIVPSHVVAHPAAEMPETADEMLRTLAREHATPSTYRESLRQTVAADAAVAGKWQAIEHSLCDAPHRLEDAAVARGLFGTDMCLSASQTETFYNCRFAYFCRYGLHIKPRRIAQVDAAAFGTIVHYVMETVLPTYTVVDGLIDTLRAADTVDDDDLMARIQRDVHTAVMRYLDTDMGGEEGKTARFLYRLRLAERAAGNLLWHTVTELRQSRFDPVEFELAILPQEPDGEDGILSIRLPFDGGQVRLVGKVDRMDLYVRADGEAFVRVVDYKTGSKDFVLGELPYGLNTQMLLYLYVICDNSHRWLQEGHTLRPAGVLYHPVTDLTVSRDAADMQKTRLRLMRMDGIVLDDASVVLAMEEEPDKVFIPATLTADGTPTGSVVTARQFALLRGVIERLLTTMAESLLMGDIAALPLRNDKHDACQYCDYRAVCARDADAPARPLEPLGDKALLHTLDEEVDENADT